MADELDFHLEAEERELFVEDVNQQLQSMESGFLALEKKGHIKDVETLNTVFRAAHTLKAVAATVGHQDMAELTHRVETLLDTMRTGRLPPSQPVIDVLLSTVDVLAALRDEVLTGKSSNIDVVEIMSQLQLFLEEKLTTAAGKADDALDIASPSQDRGVPGKVRQLVHDEELGDNIFEIEVDVLPDAFAPSARLVQVLMVAAEMGDVIAQEPSLEELSGEQEYSRLRFLLNSQADTLTVEAELRQIAEIKAVTVSLYKADTLGLDTESNGVLSPEHSLATLREDKVVRIGVERLDALMNLVGELVTDRTRLQQIEATLKAQLVSKGITMRGNTAMGDLHETVAHFDRVVEQLQEVVMQARLLPVSTLFQRFPRLVRDLAQAAGKRVDLVIEGEATELDRSVIELVGDPLVHLLRNAVDHGIETPETRRLMGKSPSGTIRLSAAHIEGQIVVKVEDDGCGVDYEKVREAAVRNGLLSEDEAMQLDDEQVLPLIFEPGMSTKGEVTDVSGRGVGLNIVQTNIKQLGGAVVVDSVPGQGTVFRLTLPLTLAILQTMLVGLGDDVYAIPLTAVVESLYLEDWEVRSLKGNPLIHWRKQVLPLLYLQDFFAHSHSTPSLDGAKPAIIVVGWGKLRCGLIVDKLIGKQDVVVKSLSPIVGNIPGVSSCTILGDGRVALIVDVPGLINAVVQAQKLEGV